MHRGNQEIAGAVQFVGEQVAAAKLARKIGAAKAVLLRRAAREGILQIRPCRTAGGVQRVGFVPVAWANAVAEQYAQAEVNAEGFV